MSWATWSASNQQGASEASQWTVTDNQQQVQQAQEISFKNPPKDTQPLKDYYEWKNTGWFCKMCWKAATNAHLLSREHTRKRTNANYYDEETRHAAAAGFGQQAALLDGVATFDPPDLTLDILTQKLDFMSEDMRFLNEKMDTLDVLTQKLNILIEKLDTLSILTQKLDLLSEKLDTLSEKQDAWSKKQLDKKLDDLIEKLDTLSDKQHDFSEKLGKLDTLFIRAPFFKPTPTTPTGAAGSTAAANGSTATNGVHG